MRRYLFVAAACLLTACGPSLKSIRGYLAKSPHRKIAVLPFTPAPGRANSGQEAADLMSEQLEEMGFFLVNRADLQKVLSEQKLTLTGVVRPEDAARIGQILGVQAVLTGTVTEASSQNVRHPPLYQSSYEDYTDSKGKVHERPTKVLVRPEEVIGVCVFSVTMRLTDVETGTLLWVGSGSDHEEDETLQEVASAVIKKISHAMGRKFLERSL